MKLPSFLNDQSISPLEYHRRALQWCKEMRESSPVAYAEEEEVWLVFGYDDSVRVRSDYKTFSSEQMISGSGQYEGRSQSIISMDPPRHRQLRSLITQAFSARTIAQMAPQIERIVDDLIDRMQEKDHLAASLSEASAPAALAGGTTKGEVDWMDAMANPLPVMVISDMLGLPRAEWRQFKAWTDAMLSNHENSSEARDNFVRYFVQAIEQRRENPGDDILSLLMTAEVDGERLSYMDLMSFCFTLFIAGNITTTTTLGNAVLCFDQYPDEFERLKQHPELAASAVEEILRTMPPGRVGPNDLIDGRTATMAVQLGNQQIRAGDRLLPIALSNNFDPSQFTDPERFDIQRNPNRHQSFGHGIHFCIGAPLARLEMKIALEKTVQRLPGLHLLRDQQLQLIDSRIMLGPKQIPVAFEAA